MTRRLAAFPAASRVAICTRVESLPLRASAPTPAASRIDSVRRWPATEAQAARSEDERCAHPTDPDRPGRGERHRRPATAGLCRAGTTAGPGRRGVRDCGRPGSCPRVGRSAFVSASGGGAWRRSSRLRRPRRPSARRFGRCHCRSRRGRGRRRRRGRAVGRRPPGHRGGRCPRRRSACRLPAPPTRLSASSAPVSESLPDPPSAVTSRPGRPGETVSWSSPPPPLTVNASAVKSTVNGTRFVRSIAARAPFGRTVNASPAAGDPLISTTSKPASPFETSEPSPLFQTSVSLPSPPRSVSVPRSPTTRSSPPSPVELVVAVAAGDQVRAVAPGERVVAGAAVKRQERERREPCGAVERVVSAEAVDRQPFGAEVDRERHQVRAVEQSRGPRSGRPC